MKIKLYNKIDEMGLKLIPSDYEVSEEVVDEDGILVRSYNLLEMEFSKNLKAIARAGAGVNNIPIEKCTEAGIAVFNTPGANANAVKELTLCALFLASRDIIGGYEWVKEVDEEDFAKKVEKGKAVFAGSEVYGKKLGVIGLGAIGASVANTAIHLGMDVLGYDPYISVNGAWGLNRNIRHVMNLYELLKEVDYLTIHVPSLKETKGFINEKTIEEMKEGVKIINLARGDLVVEKDILEGLEKGKISSYITDFGSMELCHHEKVIVLPHLGASTVESEENCAVMAVKELMDYLENGNIANSVNLPDVRESWTSSHRIAIIHRNVPNMLAKLTSVIGSIGINIENLSNKAKGEVAYTLIDTNDEVDEKKFKEIENVISVRILNHKQG